MEILLSNYYAPIVEVNDLNVLIYGKSFFDSPVKYKEKTYEKMSTNNEYIASNLLDYEYSLKHYKLIPIDLNKQTELEDLNLKQQTNFIGKLERQKDEAAMFFIIQKKQRNYL